MIPIKLISLPLFTCCLLFSLSIQAQVKKTIEDRGVSQTTTVIKEDASTDDEVLSQLDIEDYGMHEVIRITTEGKAVPVNTRPRQLNLISHARPAQAVAVNYTNQESNLAQTAQPTSFQQKQVMATHAAQVKNLPTQVPEKKQLVPSQHTGDYPVYSRKKRLKNPRFKKKRRKRKKSRKGCPKF